MELLTLKDGRVSVAPIALTIKEFSDVWEADQTKTKDNAIKELSFVYFMCWYKSPYKAYEEKKRIDKLKHDVIRDSSWEIPPRVNAAMKKFEELMVSDSPSISLLKSAQKAIHKVEDYFDTVDIKNDTKGTKMATLIRTMGSIDSIMKGLASLENKVEQELQSVGRVRGGGVIGNRELPKERRQLDK